MKAKDIQAELAKVANPEKARLLGGFFKTGPGQYGEGDIFRGVMVPEQRKIAKKYIDISLEEAEALLQSKYHEDRLTALIIMVMKYKRGDEKERRLINKTYLANTNKINNWDLVDVTVEHIVGRHARDTGGEKLLYRLAKSKSLWERRIAIVGTSHFIRNNEFEHTLKISEMLLDDKEDLIHKAVGWMLREVGKRDIKTEEEFLKSHCRTMPRTMLRYAIEKFPEPKRKAYLAGNP